MGSRGFLAGRFAKGFDQGVKLGRSRDQRHRPTDPKLRDGGRPLIADASLLLDHL
jgi:hypothetical protein